MTSVPAVRSARSAAVGGPGPSRVLTVLLTSAAYFMGTLDALVVVTALPSIHRDLGGGTGTLQWTVSAYNIAFGLARRSRLPWSSRVDLAPGAGPSLRAPDALPGLRRHAPPAHPRRNPTNPACPARIPVRPLPRSLKAWMSQPCRSSSMNAAFSPNDLVRAVSE
jgi:hypothetical protein